MSKILTKAEVLRHVADNLDAGLDAGQDLQSYGVDGWKDELVPLSAITKNFKFRLKPRTRMMNGFEVPTPLEVMPEKGSVYYTISALRDDGVLCARWNNHKIDHNAFVVGLIFATRADAIANFKAICGEDPNGGEQ